jgi:hypothetical protein
MKESGRPVSKNSREVAEPSSKRRRRRKCQAATEPASIRLYS